MPEETSYQNLKSSRLAWLVLIIQMLVVAAVLWKLGRLAPLVVPDTVSYENFPWQDLKSSLSDIRTPGYPLFLRMAGLVSQENAAVPTLQMIVYFLAVAGLYSKLRLCTQSVWGSLAAASSLLYSNILWGYVATVATDTLAAAMGIAAVALTLGVMARSQRVDFLFLGLVVTLGWVIRPAYLFLVILCPFLVWIMRPMIGSNGRVMRTRLVGATCLCSLLPVLAYCGMRGAVVGQFGIVSFGGYNLIGVSGQFLEDGDLPKLPSDVRPLAESAIRRRREASPRGVYGHEPALHYLRMETDYDPTIWSDLLQRLGISNQRSPSMFS